MKVILALVADAANVTQNDKLNILGIYTIILAKNTPALHSSMVGVFKLLPEDEDLKSVDKTDRNYKISMRIVSNDNQLIWQSPADKDITVILGRIPDAKSSDASLEAPLINIIAEIKNIKFPHFGKYYLQLRIDGKVAEVVELHLLSSITTLETQDG